MEKIIKKILATVLIATGNVNVILSSDGYVSIVLKTILERSPHTVMVSTEGISASNLKALIESAYEGKISADQIIRIISQGRKIELETERWVESEEITSMASAATNILVASGAAAKQALSEDDLRKIEIGEKLAILDSLWKKKAGYEQLDNAIFRLVATEEIPEYSAFYSRNRYSSSQRALYEVNAKIAEITAELS